MELNSGTRVVLTGAAGGLGRELVSLLATRGCALCLVDRSEEQLEDLRRRAVDIGGHAVPVAADLSDRNGCAAVTTWVKQTWDGQVDVLLHNAGLLDFLPYQASDPQRVEAIVAVNTLAPMLLTHALLPAMLERDSGRIVFVGSVLGAIGLPFYAAYSASKFAIRGFAEALRRELASSGVGVTYVGPRTMRTGINGPSVQRMAQETGLRMDDPATVAAAIVRATEGDQAEVHIGFPERLFARINGLLPRLVDIAMRQEAEKMRPYAMAD